MKKKKTCSPIVISKIGMITLFLKGLCSTTLEYSIKIIGRKKFRKKGSKISITPLSEKFDQYKNPD